MIEFKPSDVFFDVLPLIGTMEKTEVEIAAGLLVRTMYVHGNIWQPISWPQIQQALQADLKGDVRPFALWIKNPIVRPDFARLSSGKYARWTGEPGKSSIEFTADGLEAISKWVAVVAYAEGRRLGT